MRTLQSELNQLRETAVRDKEVAARRARDDEDELQILRDRCERLEAQGGGGNVSLFTAVFCTSDVDQK